MSLGPGDKRKEKLLLHVLLFSSSPQIHTDLCSCIFHFFFFCLFQIKLCNASQNVTHMTSWTSGKLSGSGCLLDHCCFMIT